MTSRTTGTAAAAVCWAVCRPDGVLTWLLLAGAILSEVSATISLKLSEGFTRLVPSVIVVVGYGVSFV